MELILVEIQVPSLSKRYDFELEQTASIKSLICEMIEIICQKEHIASADAPTQLELYHLSTGSRLNPDGTLQQNSICSGQQLILV